MPIKKSALLLLLLSAGSVSLLVFSSIIRPPADMIPDMPVKCPPVICCGQLNESITYLPWDLISQIMLRAAA